MRKTSQDGGDSTSITSGIENEIKKPGAIIKTKRNSIKRKVQNLSLDSDDTVKEPLLQKDKEKTDTTKQSAKFNLLSKTKTEAVSEEETDCDKLISDDKLEKTALSNASDVSGRILPTSTAKDNLMSKLTSENAPLHNHMNTNVFSNNDGLKTFGAPKSQILVEIDGSKHVGYNPSPLIFTTAKIHTDSKTKHMEPVQITPVPILSTIEVSVMKSGINVGETSGHVTSNISAVYIPQSNKNATEQDPKPTNKTVSNPMIPQNKVADTKNQVLTDKTEGISNTKDISSFTSSFNIETKLTQPNNATTSLKENIIENKSIKNKVEKDHAKSISQPNPSTSEKDKNIISHEVKSRGGSIASTKVTNNSIKEADKADNRCRENKINLNETVRQDSLDLQRSKPSDNVHSLDKVNKEPKDPANTSVSSRQLQRQSIIVDKDEPISQLKPNIVSPLINSDSRGFHKSDESQKSSKFENTLSDKTELPKSSANKIPTTSVTSVSTNNSVTNNITCAPTTAATLNKKSTPGNSVINQTSASDEKKISSVRNHSPIAITTSASANKSPLPIISSANQAFDPTTITSTNKNMSAANKATISTTTAAAINNTCALTTTNISKVSDLSTITTTTASNKISSSTPSPTVSTKLPSTSTANGNKISNPMTIAADTKKMSSPSTRTASNKIFAASTTNITSAKLSNPINKTGTNKTSVVTSTANAATNKLSSALPTTMTEIKISALSSNTTANSKLANSTIASTTSGMDSKISIVSSTATTGKASSPTTSIAVNKTSSPSSTATTDSKVSALSSSTIGNNKIFGSVITTTTAVDTAITSNLNSSAKPIKSLSSPLPQLSNIPITNSATVIAPSVSKPSNIDKKSSNVSSFGNNKSGTSNEISTTKSQVPNTVNIKPSSLTSTMKPVKVTTVDTPTTTSQQTVAGKSLTATTAKSVPTKPIPQPAKGKLAENTTKSSISNEKPITARSNSKSISSTTKSGTISVTSPVSAVSSGSSSASAQANKQSYSKSKVMSNGSKNFKA